MMVERNNSSSPRVPFRKWNTCKNRRDSLCQLKLSTTIEKTLSQHTVKLRTYTSTVNKYNTILLPQVHKWSNTRTRVISLVRALTHLRHTYFFLFSQCSYTALRLPLLLCFSVCPSVKRWILFLLISIETTVRYSVVLVVRSDLCPLAYLPF